MLRSHSPASIRSEATPHGAAHSFGTGGIPLFAAGFRPFYLLASAMAALWVPLWLVLYRGAAPVVPVFDPLLWHSHEMLYGFTAAVLVGFLYTAIPNWTGQPTPRGLPLAGLAGLWLLGRLVMLGGGGLNPWLVMAIDAAFLPLAALAMLPPLVRTRNRRNIAFPVALLALAAGNLALHLDHLGIIGPAVQAIPCALAVITVILVIMTGRVVPFFTANALPQAGVRRIGRLDDLALLAVIAALAAAVVALGSVAAGLTSLAAAAALAARMVPWRPAATRSVPLLWILHVGHAWIAVAFLLQGLSALGVAVPPAAAIHALTVGALGSLTLGMMSRSALGHTGRTLKADGWLAAAFVAVNLAAVIRALAPVLLPEAYLTELTVSAGLWSLAYGIFFLRFVPILIRPRADGRPG